MNQELLETFISLPSIQIFVKIILKTNNLITNFFLT